MIVWDLREFLNTAGRLRDVPEDWVDPFNHAQFMEAKRRRVQAHLQAQLQVAASTTASSAEQEAKLRQGLTALPSANDSAVVASFAPVFASLGPPLIVPEGETQKARSRSARRRRVREYQRLERLGLRKPVSGEPLPLVMEGQKYTRSMYQSQHLMSSSSWRSNRLSASECMRELKRILPPILKKKAQLKLPKAQNTLPFHRLLALAHTERSLTGQNPK
jgi:hypothetical protein